MLLEKPVPLGPIQFLWCLCSTWFLVAIPYVLFAYFFGVCGMAGLFFAVLANVILNDIEVG